ncbi:MAG TPA: glycosyl hydrolase family 65 protein [Streptosporangiaceae bacterium]
MASLATALGLMAPVAGATQAGSAEPGQTGSAARPYPAVGRGTHFLNDSALLGSTDEKAWYEANIPFLDVPDQTIQSTYYYRWRVWKEHLRPTGTANGDVLTEFFGYPGYAAPFGAINASSDQQIDEGRWARDQQPVTDDIRYWLQEAGSGPKPATDTYNSNTTDWAHEYSIWLASAVLWQAEVSGDTAAATRLLPELERQYQGWNRQYDSQLGLYWQVPVWDGMEYSASSYETDPADPYHGGAGYRPTINAYQYGDAEAIAQLAALAGQPQVTKSYQAKASALRASMQKYLWDPGRQFFYDMGRDDNPDHTLLSAREEIGYVPWMFNMPPAADSPAWAQLTDAQGFAAPYGPTTVEQRSKWFMYQAGQGCCRWDGPSWPFATSQTLTGLANLLDNYPAQSDVTTAGYDSLLHTYAATQQQDGQPHVGQAHDPSQPDWIYDANDYNHSTFNDLVISGLIGLRPQLGNTVKIQPLIPAGWDYFALENVPYHGHNVTVLWDKTGSRYHQGPGLHVYLDGRAVASAPAIRPLTIPLSGAGAGSQAASGFTDLAANVYGQGSPRAFASASGPGTTPADATDGQVIYAESQQASRWTDCTAAGSPQPAGTASDLGVDLGAAVPVSQVRLYTWANTGQGGDVAAPASYRVQYLGPDGWADVPGQRQAPASPAGNDLSLVTFPAVTTAQVRVTMTDQPGDCSGITELEAGDAEQPGARLWINGATATGLSLDEGQASTVTTTYWPAPGQSAADASVHLVAPAGWTVRPAGPGSHGTATWSVTPSASATPGEQAALYAYAVTGPGQITAYGRVAATVAYSPAAYGSQIDDQFSSAADLGNYTQLQSSVTSGTGEVAPTWSLGGGLASATAAQPWFGFLASGTAPASADSTAVVQVQALDSGSVNNSSGVFAGLVKDSSNYVMVWYNSYFHTSGEDLVLNGVLQPPGFQVACCADVTLQPGDHFAVAFSGNTLTSYYQSGSSGPWTELESTSVAPLLDLTDPATRSQYHFAFGLRGDSGAMQLSRFQAGSLGS